MCEKANLLFMLHEGLGQASFEDLESKHLVLDCSRADESVDDYLPKARERQSQRII